MAAPEAAMELEDWRMMRTGELNEVTTYYPTMEEFEDFEAYCSRKDVWASGMAHGIVKISRDHAEGVAAFFGKRPPTFTGE